MLEQKIRFEQRIKEITADIEGIEKMTLAQLKEVLLGIKKANLVYAQAEYEHFLIEQKRGQLLSDPNLFEYPTESITKK